MFAENKCISKRQLSRQCIITIVSLAFLVINPKMCRIDDWSIWGIIVGFLILLVVGRFLCSQKKNYEGIDLKLGGIIQLGIYILCVAYSIFVGALLLNRACVLAENFFLTGIPKWLIAALILVVVLLGMRGELQQHGRMMEVFFPLFTVAGILVLASVLLKISPGKVTAVSQWLPKMGSLAPKNILNGLFSTLLVGAWVLFIPFISNQVNILATEKKSTTLKRVITLLMEFGFLFFIALFLLYHIKFGLVGYQQKSFPMVSLVYSSNLWWVSLLEFGFFLTLANMLFMGDYILRLKGLMRGKYLLVALVFLLQFAL